VVKEVTHKDVITQLKHLVVTTDVGLCRVCESKIKLQRKISIWCI